MKSFLQKNLLQVGLIGAAFLLFFFRIVYFAGHFGGVEHDSGWYLGVAENLARRGIYASYTNTIGEEGVGAHPSIHGRFSVQDTNGYIYFPAGVTAGPGYVVPEAVVLKLFGSGWWQYRAWPLLSFFLLLAISFFVVWRIGGLGAFFVFALWLWAVPQFTTAFAFESFGEDIAFLYLLVGFLLAHYVFIHKRKAKVMFLAGVSLSLAYLTKNLYALAITGIAGFFLWDVIIHRREKVYLLKKWSIFLIGLVLLPMLFQVYERLFLLAHFGEAGLHAVQEDYRLHFASNGSGIENLKDLSHLDWEFIYKKILIWMDVGITQPFLIWSLLLLFPIIIVKYIHKNQRVLISSLYIAMAISFGWFVFLSPAGWARHAWQAVMIGMMLINIGIGALFKRCTSWGERALFAFVVAVILIPSVQLKSIIMSPKLTDETIVQWRSVSTIRGINGFPSNDILSYSDQNSLVQFFNEHIGKQDRVYYVGWFLNAEVSPLVDKVFYTLDRYITLNDSNPDGGKSYAIFGPYQQGMWSMEPQGYIVGKTNQLCDQIVYQNPSYLLCTLQNNLQYTNSAY